MYIVTKTSPLPAETVTRQTSTKLFDAVARVYNQSRVAIHNTELTRNLVSSGEINRENSPWAAPSRFLYVVA